MCYWLQTELKKYVIWTKVCLTFQNDVAFRNFGRRRKLPSEISEGEGVPNPNPSEISEDTFAFRNFGRQLRSKVLGTP